MRLGWHLKWRSGCQADADNFEIFITADKNLSYQQNLKNRKMAIILLSTNKWRPIKAAVQLILEALTAIQPGDFKELQIP